MANRQVILGAAMVIAAFPLKAYSKSYFSTIGAKSSLIPAMLFYAFLILGLTLIFYQFMLHRVSKIRAERERHEQARE